MRDRSRVSAALVPDPEVQRELIDSGDGHMVACHLAGPGQDVPRVADLAAAERG